VSIACNTGFGNCNGAAVDGCEVDLTSDEANCGACGVVCTASQICTAGACVATTYTGYSVSSGPASTFLNACTFGTTALSNTDDTTAAITIPFTFTYYAGMYTAGWVSSNGVLGFGAANAAYSNSCLPSGISTAIHAFWDDLDSRNGSARFCVGTTGTAPNRRYVYTAQGVFFFASDDGSRLNFSIVLNEGTDLIDLQYDTMTSPQAGRNQGNSATIGVQGPAGQSTQFSCNTASVSSGASGKPSGTSSSDAANSCGSCTSPWASQYHGSPAAPAHHWANSRAFSIGSVDCGGSSASAMGASPAPACTGRSSTRQI
jgi:hypothetical protein